MWIRICLICVCFMNFIFIFFLLLLVFIIIIISFSFSTLVVVGANFYEFVIVTLAVLLRDFCIYSFRSCFFLSYLLVFFCYLFSFFCRSVLETGADSFLPLRIRYSITSFISSYVCVYVCMLLYYIYLSVYVICVEGNTLIRSVRCVLSDCVNLLSR